MCRVDRWGDVEGRIPQEAIDGSPALGVGSHLPGEVERDHHGKLYPELSRGTFAQLSGLEILVDLFSQFLVEYGTLAGSEFDFYRLHTDTEL